MTIKQCDKCHQPIERTQAVTISLKYMWDKVELCAVCASPVTEFLKVNELWPKSQPVSLPAEQ